MLNPEVFLSLLKEQGVNFFTGVPDSLLKEFLLVLQDQVDEQNHIICSNEGQSIALAAGYQLASGQIPLVYLQNSGLGNAVNPLFSLTHSQVYGIPLLILIGWRGEPGIHDEPQHLAMGAQTRELLQLIDIPYVVLGKESNIVEPQILEAVQQVRNQSRPVALLCQSGTFQPVKSPVKSGQEYDLSREEAICLVLDCLTGAEAIVCSTGMSSRELYKHRQERQEEQAQDFLNVGAMGHTAQIALGVALSKPDRTVLCLDGDGSLIMHLGGLAIIGKSRARNLKHIILNNGVHDSVGGQPTAGFHIDVCAIATACGYGFAKRCEASSALPVALAEFLAASGPAMLEIRIRPGASGGLPRPTEPLQQRKKLFEEFLRTATPLNIR